MKTLKDLIGVESSWHVVEDLISKATNKYEILPKDETNANEALVALQQSVRSLMGAVTYETGGILIDGGWLRVLGSGHDKLTRTISNWNLGRSHESAEEIPGFLMIADDVLGGVFAVNGGMLGEDTGNIYYLAPDTLEWEPLEVSYHDFISFCFTGQINEFYENYRWSGWEDEVANLSGDNAFLIMPPLWAEGPDDIAERTRHAIPMDEAFGLLLEAAEIEAEMYDCDCEDDDCDCDCDCDDEDFDDEDDDDENNCCGGGNKPC